MIFANMLVILFLTYNTIYIINLLINKKQRIGAQQLNKELNKLRQIPVKTIEEQKKFIDLKYPKRIVRDKNKKYKFSWSPGLSFLSSIFKFIIVFQIYLIIFNYFRVDIELWQSILFVIIFPIIMNFLLAKFDLQKDGSLSVIFRFGGIKK